MVTNGVVRQMILLWMIAVCSSTAVTAQAPANPPAEKNAAGIVDDRRGLNRPLFLPDSDVPSATVRRLCFEPGGSDEKFSFFSAGDDKVVRKWSVTGAGGDFVIEPGEKIRWPLLKNDPSGLISACCCRDYGESRYLAFGGFGLPSQVLRVLNLYKNEEPQSLIDATSPNCQVTALDLHPTVPVLAACMNNGRESTIALWSIGANSKRLVTVKAQPENAHRLRFSPNGSQLLVANRAGKIFIWDFDRTAMVLKASNRSSTMKIAISDVAWINEEDWVVGGAGNGAVGGLSQGKLDDRRTGYTDESMISDAFEREDRRLTTSLASCPAKGLVAYGWFDVDLKTGKKNSGHLAVISALGRSVPRLEEVDFDGSVSAIAISDDGKYAIATGTNQSNRNSGVSGIQFRLWSLETGSLLAQFPPKEQADKVHASGSISRLGIVRTSDGKNVVCFSRGPYAQGMNRSAAPQLVAPSDPSRTLEAGFQITSPRGFVPVAGSARSKLFWHVPVAGDQNLKVTADQPVYWWYEQGRAAFGPFPNPSNPAAKISPILREFGEQICATEFQTKAGEKFIAIGYSYGILIFDVDSVQSSKVIDPVNAGIAICRGFVGHEGRTTCLEVDDPKDARVLISASDDGLISGWSLAGLRAEASQRNELGVTFELKNGKLLVKTVDETAPGFAAGFSVGQEIVDLRTPLAAGLPRDLNVWKKHLENAIPGNRLIATVRASADAATLLLQSTSLQQPLWTLYPLNDGENWAIWSPEGYFVASRGCAKSIGWQMNFPLRFNLAESYWEMYHRDVLFDDLLDSGNKRRYLSKVHGMLPPDVIFASRVSLEEEKPVASTSTSTQLAAASDELKVNVKVERTTNEVIKALELWCNGFLFKQVSDIGASAGLKNGLEESFLIDSKYLRSDSNLITAVVQSELSGTTLYNEKRMTVVKKRSSEKPEQPRLHFLGIGVTTLDHDAGWKRSTSIPPLRYAANDVVHLAMAVQDISGPELPYATGQVQVLFNPVSLQAIATDPGSSRNLSNVTAQYSSLITKAKAPTKANILAALQQFCVDQPPQPDDLLVIQLSGHGFDENASGAPNSGVDEFYFVAQDTDPQFGQAVTRTEIEQFLNKLTCKTLLLVDCCYAGAMLSPEKALRNRVIGPQIMTSCSDTLSYESGQGGGKDCGYGVFTAAVIEGLSGRQLIRTDREALDFRTLANGQLETRNSDHFLSVEELCGYVKQRVPELMKILNLPETQSPQIQTSPSFFTESTLLKPLAKD